MKKERFLIHAVILAVAGFVSRALGLFYAVPLYHIIGEEGNGYYGTAYEIYNILLLITAYSMPMAISKIMSVYVAEKDYVNCKRLLRTSLFYVFIVGGVGAVVTYIFADELVVAPAVLSLKVMAPTIFFSGILSVLRGYTQAHNTMVPTALSQIVEQIFNAIFSVLLAYILVGFASKGGGYDILDFFGVSGVIPPVAYGAMGSALGTFLGVLVALGFMIVYIMLTRRKRRELYNKKTDTESPTNIATATEQPANIAIDTGTPTNTAIDTGTPANAAIDTGTPANTAIDTGTPANIAIDTGTPANTAIDTGTPANIAIDTEQPANIAIDTGTPANTAIDTKSPANIAIDTGTPGNTAIDTKSPTNTHVVDNQAYKVETCQSTHHKPESYFRLFRVIFRYASPIILTSFLFNLATTLDMIIFWNWAGDNGYSQSTAASIFGIFSRQYMVLINVPIAVASAISSSMMPGLSVDFAANEVEEVKIRISKAVRSVVVFAVPSVVGLTVLSKPIMQLLFKGTSNAASEALIMGSISVLFFSVATVLNSGLQAMGKSFIAIKNVIRALIIHALYLVGMLKLSGAVMGTLVTGSVIFSAAMCFGNINSLEKYFRCKLRVLSLIGKPVLTSILMGVIAVITYSILMGIGLNNFLSLLVTISLSIIVYFFMFYFQNDYIDKGIFTHSNKLRGRVRD